MFEKSNVFCTMDKDNYEVRKLRVNRSVQRELTNAFSLATRKFTDDTIDFLKFDGRYKPENNEIQYIDDFILPESITNSIKEPLSINELLPKQTSKLGINALFIGTNNKDDSIIAFQNFQRGQIVTGRGISIILDQNTFKKFDSLALNIKEEVDCFYKNKKLYFSSFWIARQIFDLSDYYNSATDEDLNEFTRRNDLHFSSKSKFMENTDTWIRRKVALIQDANTLDKYTPNEIKEKAIDHNVDLKLKDGQLMIPEEKSNLKVMLKFLDEDIYKGPFSNETYETNSKRAF